MFSMIASQTTRLTHTEEPLIIKGLEILLDESLVLDYHESIIIKYKEANINISQSYDSIKFTSFDLVLTIDHNLFAKKVNKGKSDLLIFFFSNWRNLYNAVAQTGFQEWCDREYKTVAIFTEDSIKFNIDNLLKISLVEIDGFTAAGVTTDGDTDSELVESRCENDVLNIIEITTENSKRLFKINKSKNMSLYKFIRTTLMEYAIEKISKDLGVKCVQGINCPLDITIFLEDDYYMNLNIKFVSLISFSNTQKNLIHKKSFIFECIDNCIKKLSEVVLLANKVIKYNADTLSKCSTDMQTLLQNIKSDTKFVKETKCLV